MIFFFLQDGDKKWSNLFSGLASSPVTSMIWIVVLLVILFILSRFNNYLEVRGVNRAIGITRALVGSFMYFIVAPVVLFVFINAMAYIYRAPLINVSFLWDWIQLTGSSYFWLLKCMFRSEGVLGQEEAYTIHSMVRVLWILIPLSLIWLRTTKKRMGRLLLIPIVIGIIGVTRHKIAPETFITTPENITRMQQVPYIGFLFEENKSKSLGFENGLSPLQRRVISGVLVVLLLSGLGVGLFGGQRIVGLVLAMLGVFGFMFIAPSKLQDDIIPPKNKEHPFHHNIDSLIHRLDSIYALEGDESLEVYNLTIKIDQAYLAQQHKEEFPDSLCKDYSRYFYDRCK
jgi:hypothetical protein